MNDFQKKLLKWPLNIWEGRIYLIWEMQILWSEHVSPPPPPQIHMVET